MKTEGVINYTGNKSKLMKRLNELFQSSKASRLVDVCAGGLSVTLHSEFDKVLANDINPVLTSLYEYLSTRSFCEIDSLIDSHLVEYNLGKLKDQKDFYSKYKDETNDMFLVEGYSVDVLVRILILQYHSFSNMIRFNTVGEYNVPFGQRTYNKSSQRKLKDFYDIIQKKEIEFSNLSFEKLKINDNDLVYVDPPYLITEAVYNAGWDKKSDKNLMDWLDELDRRGVEFVMSNVFHHRGKSNDELIEWSKKYNVHAMNHTYVFNSYHAKDQNQETIEVMITNLS